MLAKISRGQLPGLPVPGCGPGIYYAFPSSDHVHRCSLNGGLHVVKVAEYTCKVCQGHNEFLIFKMPCYATILVSQKLLNFFAQLKNE